MKNRLSGSNITREQKFTPIIDNICEVRTPEQLQKEYRVSKMYCIAWYVVLDSHNEKKKVKKDTVDVLPGVHIFWWK